MKTTLALLILAFISTNASFAQNFGEIRGQLIDENGQPVYQAAVVVFSGETQIAATTTNETGNYVLKPIPAGTYTVMVQHMSYQKLEIESVVVGAQQTKYLDATLSVFSHQGPTIVIVAPNDIVDKSKTFSGQVLNAKVIKESPSRDVKDFVATTPGVVQRDEGGSINIRGSREGGTQYIVDGIKMIGGFSIPKAAIEEITILTGGIPAQFGDATGGIVIITTKSFIGR